MGGGAYQTRRQRVSDNAQVGLGNDQGTNRCDEACGADGVARHGQSRRQTAGGGGGSVAALRNCSGKDARSTGKLVECGEKRERV
ncbi:hypothetical protein E2562_004903 [Oryza meyeriana var. granulata]|uniref:Uncharacterized protein n=1 Tax=Oryza meyeriana var. granulata TaxID=110450 RepID=A0A6G1C411_9ORYZ|nr:hypothetical protein E2562_004903 [Oryza meyeriana var. granulata]